jgi:hypothetical protein
MPGICFTVNQRGEIRAAGGTNEKIEGFHAVCQAKGLTSEQGVIIPQGNVTHLMLRQEVVDAVRDGRFQVQTNLQTIVGVLNWGLDLQSAIDAPRWVSLADGRIAMESRFPQTVARDLEARGHTVQLVGAWEGTLARSQVIASRAEGGWAAASDLRGEGIALAV